MNKKKEAKVNHLTFYLRNNQRLTRKNFVNTLEKIKNIIYN